MPTDPSQLDPSHPLYPSLKRLVEGLTVVLKQLSITQDQLVSIIQASFETVDLPLSHQSPDPDFLPETSPMLAAMLGFWHSHPNYLDDLGSPIAIPKNGPAPSIEAIYDAVIKTFAHLQGKISSEDAFNRLLAHGNLSESGDAYSVHKRHFMSNRPGSGGHSSLSYAADYMHTCAHNSLAEPNHGYFQRTCNTPRFPVEKVAFISQLLEDQGMDFLVQMDNIIEREKLSDPADDRSPVRLTVGIYLAVADAPPVDD